MELCGNHQYVNITKVRVLDGITFQEGEDWKQMKTMTLVISTYRALGCLETAEDTQASTTLIEK